MQAQELESYVITGDDWEVETHYGASGILSQWFYWQGRKVGMISHVRDYGDPTLGVPESSQYTVYVYPPMQKMRRLGTYKKCETAIAKLQGFFTKYGEPQ